MARRVRLSSIGRTAVGALTALLPACYQGSQPLTPEVAGATDARLDGEWRCLRNDHDDVVRLSVRSSGSTRHEVTMRVPGEDPDRYVAHVSRLGEADIANVRELGEDGTAHGAWVYVRYRVPREGLLDLSLVDEKPLAQAKDEPAALDEIRAHPADERLF